MHLFMVNGPPYKLHCVTCVSELRHRGIIIHRKQRKQKVTTSTYNRGSLLLPYRLYETAAESYS